MSSTNASTVRSRPENVGLVPTDVAAARFCPRWWNQHAYTPSAGIAACSPQSTFAVG